MPKHVDQIACLLTEDPDILNEFVLEQYEKFWRALASDPDLAPLARNQDINELVQAYGENVGALADFAEEQGWSVVARDLRQKAGIGGGPEGYWTGAAGPGIGRSDTDELVRY